MMSATFGGGGGGGQRNSDILPKVADTKLCFGWEKNEVNGSNH